MRFDPDEFLFSYYPWQSGTSVKRYMGPIVVSGLFPWDYDIQTGIFGLLGDLQAKCEEQGANACMGMEVEAHPPREDRFG